MTFKQFLEDRMLGKDQSNVANTMKIVGQSTRDMAVDALAGLAGPVGSVAKSILSAAWSQRKNILKKIQDDNALSRAKQIISTRISQKAQGRQGNVDAIIDSYVKVTDESEIHLNEQERQLVINAILEAINNNTIQSGYAQELVNNILQQKINLIQSAITSSQPKKLVV